MKAEIFLDHVALNLEPFRLSDEEFFHFATQSNARMEREADGTILIMQPTEPDYSSINADITTDLNNWNRETSLGKTYDSSAGFSLSDKSVRSPDAAWIEKSKLEALKAARGKTFPYICPDFVMELRPPSDTMAEQKRKMEQYMANGCRLGWLLDPVGRTAWVYRPGQEPECLEGFNQKLSGEGVLPGFVLDLARLELPE